VGCVCWCMIGVYFICVGEGWVYMYVCFGVDS
jgi:hypothetical protein